MVKPDTFLIQEIKTLPAKAKVMAIYCTDVKCSLACLCREENNKKIKFLKVKRSKSGISFFYCVQRKLLLFIVKVFYTVYFIYYQIHTFWGNTNIFWMVIKDIKNRNKT